MTQINIFWYNKDEVISLKKETRIFPNVAYVDLYPIQFGYERCEPSHHVPLRTNHNYLFHYITDGVGTFNNEYLDHKRQVHPQEGFLITPNTKYSYRADTNKPWTYYWIEFNGIKAQSLMKKAGLSAELPIYQQNDHLQKDAIQQIFLAFLSLESEEYGMSLLYQLMHLLIKGTQSPNETKNDITTNFYIQETLKYITRHIDQDITVEDLANHCHLSRTYLTKLFKNELGVTPAVYMTNYKLKKAATLLKESKQSINDISQAVGYRNQFVFSSAFKRKYGISPSQWRNQ